MYTYSLVSGFLRNRNGGNHYYITNGDDYIVVDKTVFELFSLFGVLMRPCKDLTSFVEACCECRSDGLYYRGVRVFKGDWDDVMIYACIPFESYYILNLVDRRFCKGFLVLNSDTYNCVGSYSSSQPSLYNAEVESILKRLVDFDFKR